VTTENVAARSRETGGHRDVTDDKGRVFRIGETDREILGFSRSLMVWLPWAAMFAISVFEYAFGSVQATLSAAHHWSSTNTYWMLSVWVFFQAAVSFPTGKLREKGILSSRRAMIVGSGLTLVGYLAVANVSNIVVALIGYGVLGGTGAGMIYSTCVNMTGKWFPERRGGKVGFVNGAFAYGSVPFIFLFTYGFHASNYRLVLDLVGVYMMAVTLIAGMFFKDPPKNWWPAHIDPLTREGDAKSAAAMLKNPPSSRQYTPGEAIRTGILPLMWVCMLCCAGVSIFGISFQVPFAKVMGFGPLIAASSMGLLAVINGVGRGLSGWLSDRLGRRMTLFYVLTVLGVAQFGILWAGSTRNEVMFLFFAFLSGIGGGGFFPLFAAIVPDYFGEHNNAANYGLVYSSKFLSGIFGGGIGAAVVAAFGFSGAYLTAGVIGLLSAGMSLLLRRPGGAAQPTGSAQPSGAIAA
jgi:MFS family permease